LIPLQNFMPTQYHAATLQRALPRDYILLQYRTPMPYWNEHDLDFPSIDLHVNRPKWIRDRNCLDEPVDTFYPAPGDVERLRRAKSICKECVVRHQCLEHALNTNERFGIWGGKSARERSLILRAARLVARPRNED
jgi:WhiB family transcriptional regulator, redox-sensing transcriptional regulator